MRVFRATLLLFKKDYAIQCSISLLGTSRKQLQQDIDKANWNKLRCQPVAALREEETMRLIFNCCKCTPEIKLNIEWQMALLAKKINIDMTDKIVTLAPLYWVKNFISCNKHFYFLARYLGLATRKISVVDISSLNSVEQHQSVVNFKQQVTKISNWFMELVLTTLLMLEKAGSFLLGWDNLLLLFLVVETVGVIFFISSSSK